MGKIPGDFADTKARRPRSNKVIRQGTTTKATDQSAGISIMN